MQNVTIQRYHLALLHASFFFFLNHGETLCLKNVLLFCIFTNDSGKIKKHSSRSYKQEIGDTVPEIVLHFQGNR